MKRAGHVFERVADFHALCAAARRAARGKHLGPDAARFLLDLEPEVLGLERALLDGSYAPAPYRTFRITDPKPRTISAAAFRDRVVHHALCAALEPTLERYAIADSYACRRGKGGVAALRRAQHFCRRSAYFLKLDVRKFFETADHDVLKALLRRLVKDRRALALCDRFIDAGSPGCSADTPQGTGAGRGLPIGNLTSQHFANLYLGRLDHFVKGALHVRGYVRYMDDTLYFAASRAALRDVRDAVQAFIEGSLRLRLRDEVTVLSPVRAGVPFLGFRVWSRLVRLDPHRSRRFRRLVRARTRDHRDGLLDGDAWNRSLASLCGWVAQGDTAAFRRETFRRMRDDGLLPC